MVVMVDMAYQEALRRYQVDIAKFEVEVEKYRKAVNSLKEGDPRPISPIPPILPVRPVKLKFAEEDPLSAELGTFNEGVEAAAVSLEDVGEKDLAAWVRRHKR